MLPTLSPNSGMRGKRRANGGAASDLEEQQRRQRPSNSKLSLPSLPAIGKKPTNGLTAGAKKSNSAANTEATAAAGSKQPSPLTRASEVRDLEEYFRNVKKLEAFLLRVLRVVRVNQPEDLAAFILEALATNEQSLNKPSRRAAGKNSAADKQRYKKQVLDPLLSDMMAKLVLYQPADAMAWMAQYLHGKLSHSQQHSGVLLPAAVRSFRPPHGISNTYTEGNAVGGINGASRLSPKGKVHLSALPASTPTQLPRDSHQASSFPSQHQLLNHRSEDSHPPKRASSPSGLDEHLKPHIAVAPAHNELFLIYQNLVLQRSNVFAPGNGDGDSVAVHDFGSINPFFLQQRYAVELHSLQGPRRLFYDAFMARDLDKLDMLFSHGFVLASDVLVDGGGGGWTPLMAATRFGWVDVVQLLLSHRASPLDARTSDQMMPVFLAAASQNTDLLDLLLNWVPVGHPSKLDAAVFALRQLSHTVRGTQENVLQFAARKGYYQIVEFLLRKMQQLRLTKKTQRSLINSLNVQGATALFKAVLDGRHRIVQVLTSCRYTDVNMGAFLDPKNRPPKPELALSPAQQEAQDEADAIRKAMRGTIDSDPEENSGKNVAPPRSASDFKAAGDIEELLIEPSPVALARPKLTDQQASDASRERADSDSIATESGEPVERTPGATSEALTTGSAKRSPEMPGARAPPPQSGSDELIPLASPLQAAVLLGKQKIVKHLIKKGAFVGGRLPINPWENAKNVTSSISLNLLELACLGDSQSILEALCTRCKPQNFEDPTISKKDRRKQNVSMLSAPGGGMLIPRTPRCRWFLDHNVAFSSLNDAVSCVPSPQKPKEEAPIAHDPELSPKATHLNDLTLFRLGFTASLKASGGVVPTPTFTNIEAWRLQKRQGQNVHRDPSVLKERPLRQSRQEREQEATVSGENDVVSGVTVAHEADGSKEPLKQRTVKDTALSFWWLKSGRNDDDVVQWSNHIDRGTSLTFFYCLTTREVSWVDPRSGFDLDGLLGSDAVLLAQGAVGASSHTDKLPGTSLLRPLPLPAVSHASTQGSLPRATMNSDEIRSYHGEDSSLGTATAGFDDDEGSITTYNMTVYTGADNTTYGGEAGTNVGDDDTVVGDNDTFTGDDTFAPDNTSFIGDNETYAGNADDDTTFADGEDTATFAEIENETFEDYGNGDYVDVEDEPSSSSIGAGLGEQEKPSSVHHNCTETIPNPNSKSAYFDQLVAALQTEDEGVDELCLAAENDDAVAVRALLDRRVCPINAKGSAGRTALMVACAHGCNEAVKALLNYHLQQQLLPQHQLARYAQGQRARASSGPNSFPAAVETWRRCCVCGINERSLDGLTALLLASYAGQSETVRILLNRLVSPPREVPSGILRPLRKRQSQRQLLPSNDAADKVAQLQQDSVPAISEWWPALESDLAIDVSCALPSGATSLHLAAQQCHLRVIATLTDMGVDGEGPCPVHCVLNAHNSFGQTALTMSAERGRVDIMELLLDAKANLELAEATPLACPPIVCASKLGVRDAVACLLRAGANVNTPAADGTTALYHACFRGDDDLAKMLLDVGAELEVVDTNSGNTPVLVAAVDCCVELMTRLLRDNADIDVKNNRGLSARLLLQKVYGLTVDQLYVHSLSGRKDSDFGIGDDKYEASVRAAFAARCGRYRTHLDLDDLIVVLETSLYDISKLLDIRQARRWTNRQTANEIGGPSTHDRQEALAADKQWLEAEKSHVMRLVGMHFSRMEAMNYATAKAAAVPTPNATDQVIVERGLNVDDMMKMLHRFRRLHMLKEDPQCANKGHTLLVSPKALSP